MDTKLATRNIRIQQWATVIKSKTESGLTVSEFCEQNSISKNRYYYWLRKVKNAVLEQAGTRFAELKVGDEATGALPMTTEQSFAPQLTIERNGHVIGINRQTPKELLAMALEVAADVK